MSAEHEVRELTVLLADTDPGAPWDIRSALARLGFDVVAEAHDADAAIDAAREHRPALCLLELELPGDGLTAARRIHETLPETRVAVLADSSSDGDALQAVYAGADGYLFKDMAPDQLAQALRAMARGEPALPRAVTEKLVNEVRSLHVEMRPQYGIVNRTVLYVPRFLRHFRRRVRSRMPVGLAWQSARHRMRDYGQPRVAR